MHDKMREIVRQQLLLKISPKHHGVKWYSLDIKALTSINYEMTLSPLLLPFVPGLVHNKGGLLSIYAPINVKLLGGGGGGHRQGI